MKWDTTDQNIYTQTSLSVSLQRAGSVSHSCHLSHAASWHTLLTPSSEPEGGTADVSALAYHGYCHMRCCGSPCRFSQRRVRERERDRERMSAGLVESGELWHPQNGQVSLYLTACLHRFNKTLAALLRFALHRVQFIQTPNNPTPLLFWCDVQRLGQTIGMWWETQA